MPVEMDSLVSSPVGSFMSVSSASTPGTPGSGHYQFTSTSTNCDFSSSDAMDSDMDNNNVNRNLSSATSLMNTNQVLILKSEPKDDKDIENTPKKKRYSKSRARNRSPALVQKLRKTRRSKANDRERTRMHSLNDALDGLRQILPNAGDENKLTKIETLRFAYNYIFALSETVNMLDRGESVDVESSLYSAQVSAAMKQPSASQTLSHIHQQQKQRQQNLQQTRHHHQAQQLSPVGHQPQLSPVNYHNHRQQTQQQQYSSAGMHLPQMPVAPVNIKMENFSSPQCQEMSSVSSRVLLGQSSCFTSGTPTVNQVQTFVSVTPISPCNVLTSSPVSHVPNYNLCGTQFPWNGVPRVSHVFTDHPHSPAGYSDTSEGYTFEMM